MTLYAEKLLPHDIEAEEAVIGSLLIDGECFSRLAPVLQGADFYRERNQLCYDAAMALFLRDQAIDQTTMAGELARTERLDTVGGMAYLSHLVAITPTSAHAEDYAENVQRTSRRQHASQSWATTTRTTSIQRCVRRRTRCSRYAAPGRPAGSYLCVRSTTSTSRTGLG